MSRYPEEARQATIKCIGCNAPVVRTVDDSFACVECGESPIHSKGADGEERSVGDDTTFAREMTEQPAD